MLSSPDVTVINLDGALFFNKNICFKLCHYHNFKVMSFYFRRRRRVVGMVWKKTYIMVL